MKSDAVQKLLTEDMESELSTMAGSSYGGSSTATFSPLRSHSTSVDSHSSAGYQLSGVHEDNTCLRTPANGRLKLRLRIEDPTLSALQGRNMRQDHSDARACAYFFAIQGACYGLVAAAALIGFGVYASKAEGYMVFYMLWAVFGVVAGLWMKAKSAFSYSISSWKDASRVHIVLEGNECPREFKAVGQYLEASGLIKSHVRLRIEQDEDDIEEVQFHYSPWVHSFTLCACIYGTSEEAPSIVFRTFCPHRWLQFFGLCGHRCGASHGHFELTYQRGDRAARSAVLAGDSITFSVEDHNAEVVRNFILRAYNEYIQPKNAKVDVYSAGGSSDSSRPPSWEFMQYISPMGPDRTGRFTYVPGTAFSQIVDEYKRVVELNNESLTVLVTGASRSGKSAMVTALAHLLGIAVYSLNLKAKFLTEGGLEALFSHRAISYRPVLVHMEEFSLMFQETVCGKGRALSDSVVAYDGEEDGAAPTRSTRYEGLQRSSTLNCSDLLKLFDQSGTTSPKRIFFVLTCIALPEQFDAIQELRPLMARGRIQHFHLDEPTDEVIKQYLLQYFFPEARRSSISPSEYQRLDAYNVQMKERLGKDATNWHAVKKYAEVYPLAR